MSREDPRTDEQLVAAANAGDVAAFETLYHRYRDWVVNLACRTIGDRDAALDVLQDTFSYLLTKFPGFELRAKMTTFLYPVVRHRAIELRRKAQRFRPPPEPTAEPQAPAGSDPAESPADPRAALAQVMSCLSESHREVVLLRFVDGLDLRQIAEAMAIPLGTVKSRLHHALRQLRDDPAVRKYWEP